MKPAAFLDGAYADNGTNDVTGANSSNQYITRTSPSFILFRLRAQELFPLSANSESFIARREKLVRQLKVRHEFELLTELLRVATSSSNVDRLGIAVDILASLGPDVLKFAKKYTLEDICNRGFCNAKPWQPNADFWYILLRAVAKCDAPIEEREEFILRFIGSHDAFGFDMLEGLIESLGDLATSKAITALKGIADQSKSTAACELASDVLADIC